MSGWPVVTMATAAEIVSGGTPKSAVEEYWDGEIPWATPKDLSKLQGPYISSTPRNITDLGLRDSSAVLLPANSVLFSSRAPIGHVAINTVAMATNQGFKSLVPKENISDSGYLYHWLRANRAYLESLGNGATFKEVSKAVVSRVELPLPPIEEQRRIAAILDHADALRAKRREALARLDELTQSIFIDMFGDPSTPPSGSDSARIGDFVSVSSGSTPSRAESDYYGGSIPWVKTTEVNNDRILGTSECVTEQGMKAARLALYPVGSILIAMYGQGATRGRVALLGIPATTNQACAVLAPGEKHIPEFMFAQLRFSYERLRDQGRGGNQPNLNGRLVSDFPVILPPVERQSEFARHGAVIDALRGQHRTALTELDALFASLQSRAFKGEL